MFDQQPGRLAAIIPFGAHENPRAVHTLALHDELQLALGQRLSDILEPLFWRPISAVPQHHGPATVFPLRDRSFEIPIVERVVLHLHGQATVPWVHRRALWDGPGSKGPVVLEPKVKVQVTRRVLLDDEAERLGRYDLGISARRFGRPGEVTH